MKKTLGIITEYNPFHNGHLYNIIKGKEITNTQNVVVAMSGNFVQRGQPAIIDKYIRCKMALLQGADLCLEIPTHFALESAEYFSKCGVSILDKSKIVDKIVFGSESGDIDSLKSIASFLQEENESFKDCLKENLSKGNSYPKAISETLLSFGFQENYTANNTLGIQYLIALLEQKSSIEPYTIKREGSTYHDTTLNNTHLGASATAIRDVIYNQKDMSLIKNYVPENLYDIIIEETGKNFTKLDNLSSLLHYKLSFSTKDELREINHVNEGLENLILDKANKYFLISDIIENATSKRYTKSKLSRTILSIILDIKKTDIALYKEHTYPPYIRVLGYRKEKEFLLKELVKNSTLPVVVNVNRASLPPLAKKMLEEEKNFSKIYNLSFNNAKASKYSEVESKPIII